MATGASSLAKVGLTHNVGKRESARQDLATMSQMVQIKQEEEQKEQQAALVEQQYYEQIRKEADQMLSGDRKRINERSKTLQGQIRQQIKAFGGSRAKFMASGGMAMLGDYTRGVLESPEVAQYKENQKNLTEILDIKKKGLGHLLSARDKLHLEDYNQNGTGTITYSGLKSQVEIPPADSFEFGTYATPSEILWHGDNYLKILGNYKIDHPESPIEEMNREDQARTLLSYTLAEGWTQRGTKVFQDGRGRYGSGRDGTGNAANPKPKKITQTGELNVVLKTNNKPIGIEDMSNPALRDNEYLNDNYGGIMYKKRATVDKTFLEAAWKTAVDIGTLGLNTLNDDWDANNGFAPRGASDLGKTLGVPMFKTQNGDNYDILPGGIIKGFVPKDSSNFYLANGVPINGEDMDDGDYKVTGSFIGYEMNAMNGNYMVVDAYDTDGKIDKERNDSLYKSPGTEEQPKGKKAAYISIEDEDGNQYYQKVDLEGTVKQSDLAIYLGDFNELSDQYEEDDAKKTLLDESGQQATVALLGKPKYDIPEELFENNTDFKAMVNVFNKYNGTSTLREDLMKGFYMANYDFATDGEEPSTMSLDEMINANIFGMFLTQLGLDRRVEDQNLSDGELLDLIQSRILSENHSTTPEEKSRNFLLMTKIRNYMSKVNSNVGRPKAKFGANLGFTPGSEWSVVENFRGPSHAGGGIDVNVNEL